MFILRVVTVFFISELLMSCSFLLPSKKVEKNDNWKTFNSVQSVYDKVIPNKTTLSELNNIGFNPYAANNVKVESYLDVRHRFDPLSTGKNIPESVSECLHSYKRCKAYVINIEYEHEKHVGNVLLDLAGFRKEIINDGWGFKAIFIIQDELVVYKIWSGEPKRRSYTDEIKPLGPLQSLDGLITAPKISF